MMIVSCTPQHSRFRFYGNASIDQKQQQQGVLVRLDVDGDERTGVKLLNPPSFIHNSVPRHSVTHQ